MYPSAFLIHTATLQRTVYSDTEFDENGERKKTVTSTTVKCRFSRPVQKLQGNPLTITSTPQVTLPAGTEVSEGDTLVSTVQGFSGTFRIGLVKITYEAAMNVVSHITCEIAAAGATGGA